MRKRPRRCVETSPEGASVPKGQKRIALVIGNNEYKESPLRNPTHDAEDIANVLQGLGFTVQMKINADQRQMEEAVKEFAREIQNGDVGLFYFSGHGVQVGGDNYLIPVGGSIETETDVRYKALNAGLILGKMEESRNRTNIFILDACRNNPFKGFRSLSKGLNMMDAPVGTFIAYATAPGSVAADGSDRNSPYAKHLILALKSRGVPIEMVFKQVLRGVRKETEGKQVPWTASSLPDDFYFSPGENSAPVAAPAETPSPEPAPPQEASVRPPQISSTPSISGESDVAKLKRLSNQGNAQAQCDLGYRLVRGDGVPKDLKEAAKWFRKAADQGHSVAQNMMGWCYDGGNGVPQDSKEAVNWYKKGAENGSISAQFNLAERYKYGRGVPQNHEYAVKWYRRAAEQGHAGCQANLGNMYRDGLGVPKDYGEAVKWYRKAADQGNAQAQCDLGYQLVKGDGVAKDLKEAAKWFRKAADQGHSVAQNMMGWCYDGGNGVPQDSEEAVKWYTKGAENGSIAAQFNLAVHYQDGRGVQKNQEYAVKWFRKAAESGHAGSQAKLGNMCRDGLGVPKDQKEAIKWYQKAAEQGNEYAKQQLRNLGVAVQ